MENTKLTEITQRLYDEGLAKGRAEGERMEAEAQAEAAKIVKTAEERAAAIERKAQDAAQELRTNTLTEIALAGREAVARVKEELAGAIVARTLGDGVKRAGMDPEFLKNILLEIAKNWRGGAGKVTLEALLPEARRSELEAELTKNVSSLLAEGVEVGYSADVKSGFKVGERGGGYYIGFSDENFEALLSSYLRERVVELLYK